MTLSLATRWPSRVAPLVEFIKERFGMSHLRFCGAPAARQLLYAHAPCEGCDAPSLGDP